MKAQIRYEKIVLGFGSRSGLKLTGNKEVLISSLKQHLESTSLNAGDTGISDNRPVTLDADSPIITNGSAPHQSSRKRRWDSDDSTDEESVEDDCTDSGVEDAIPFAFQRQVQRLSVYYDNTFYIGQVLKVYGGESAVCKFMEQTKDRQDYFRWPPSEDIAEVAAHYVFKWVNPVSNDDRMWSVPAVNPISRGYEKIKTKSL